MNKGGKRKTKLYTKKKKCVHHHNTTKIQLKKLLHNRNFNTERKIKQVFYLHFVVVDREFHRGAPIDKIVILFMGTPHLKNISVYRAKY